VIRLLFVAIGCSLFSAAGAVDVEEAARDILSRIQAPENAVFPFVELRKNRLLEEPMVLSGEMDFSSTEGLSKLITSPFVERVTISSVAVEIERDGETRRLLLKRKRGLPEFYSGLKALMDKDLTTLLALFDVESVTAGDEWTIVLIPVNPNLQKSLERMIITGRKARVTVIRTVQSPDVWQELSFEIPESG
jgi:hypothetical protein